VAIARRGSTGIARPGSLGVFSRAVYSACASIPRGKVSTYAAIARVIGSPRAVRAVGNALNKNPFPPSRVPCHRIIRSDGDVGGFTHGRAGKIRLLKKEGVIVKNGMVDLARFGSGFKLPRRVPCPAGR